MKNRIATLSLALALGVSSAVMAQQQAMTEPQVQTRLTEQGYTHVNDLKFKDGMWQADAKSANGKSVKLRVDAKTGQVYPDKQVSKLSKHDINAALTTQGYTDVHDVKFDDGIWKAKAKNPSGKHVKVKVDADSGKVIGAE
ncbi:PepSY domain-containing protein [Rhodanobacter sp. L36]|uniref:PepSY domain-containing protein n=1 Tax=Rhodanobacter sp. L36 TaxID=1747221 RepID=UPI00131C2614|nr:PepSY domain-containing protein [Rhodanobacter sp. L36]